MPRCPANIGVSIRSLWPTKRRCQYRAASACASAHRWCQSFHAIARLRLSESAQYCWFAWYARRLGTCMYLLSYVFSSFRQIRSNSTWSSDSARPAQLAASLVRAPSSRPIWSATSSFVFMTFAWNSERQPAYCVYWPLNFDKCISLMF